MVNVTKYNFIEQSNDLIEHLPDAAFIAIDEEMTGISLPSSRRPPRDECPSQQYTKYLKEVPERYSIIQWGISLFEPVSTSSSSNTVRPPPIFINNNRGYAVDTTSWGGETTPSSSSAGNATTTGSTPTPTPPAKEWKVRRYNFYMFPDKYGNREVVLNPGAIAFLQSHNMSLDTWCSKGIPYICTGNVAVSDNTNSNRNNRTKNNEAATAIAFPTAFEAFRVIEDYTNKARSERDDFLQNNPKEPSVEATVTRKVQLTYAEDIAFFARVMAGIREWLDNPITVPSDTTVSTTATTATVALAATQTATTLGNPTTGDGGHLPPPPPNNNNNNMVPANNHNANANGTDNDNPTNAATLVPTPTSTLFNGPNNNVNSNTSLLLPPCNAFLRRALYESIHQEYPSLITENYGKGQIRVLRLSDEERTDRFKQNMNDKWNQFIVNRIGMWRIFTAISLTTRGYTIPTTTPLFAKSYEHILWDSPSTSNALTSTQLIEVLSAPYLDIVPPSASTETTPEATNAYVDNSDTRLDGTTRPKVNIPDTIHRKNPVPLVVHNGFMDLLFLMTHFCCTILPPNLIDTKRLLLSHFPIIYDTKVIASECCIGGEVALSSNTTVSNLFQIIVKQPQPFFSVNSSDGISVSSNNPNDSTASSYSLLDLIEVVKASSKASSSITYGRGLSSPSSSGEQKHQDPLKPTPQQNEEEDKVEDQEHEAAFDAYMTGAIFIGLYQRLWYTIKQQVEQRKATLGSSSNEEKSTIERIRSEFSKLSRQDFINKILLSIDDDDDNDGSDNTVPREYTGRNKLYQMSLYTLDLELLEELDPLQKNMLMQSTFRVSGFDKSLTTGDIVSSLSRLHDSSGRTVNYEIIWIDDTSFVVAAVYKPINITRIGPDGGSITIPPSNPSTDEEIRAILREHGRIIGTALDIKFNKNQESVVTLEEYHKSLFPSNRTNPNQPGQQSRNYSWMKQALSYFGLVRSESEKSDNGSTNDHPPRKRRRV